MQPLLFLIVTFLLICFTYSADVKTPMTNSYPQVAILGCDSAKANLYYDIQRQVWVAHLLSSCVNSKEGILEFCQQAYPSLQVGNIVQLATALRFQNWCELMPPTDGLIPLCKNSSQLEESVRPFRCLHDNSKRENVVSPALNCNISRVYDSEECRPGNKWEERASIECTKQDMVLNSSIMTLDWCGLDEFRGAEFICCPLRDAEEKTGNDADYQTSSDEREDDGDEALTEDDPILELVVVPKVKSVDSRRKLLAKSHSPSVEPKWLEDSRRWNTDSGYFADDEDTDDEESNLNPSSRKRKSQVTINEHDRFTKDKEDFRRKYNEQVEQLKSRRQQRQYEIQLIANRDPVQAQNQYETSEVHFRQEYDVLKQTADRERARINELHEKNLDQALDTVKNETYDKLIAAWKTKPLKTEKIDEAVYHHIHVLLRDRIHLVNRYERLRAIDPEQASSKRASIHERLRSTARQVGDVQKRLQRSPKTLAKIQPHIDQLISEYEEVNRAAEKLLAEYDASLKTTTVRQPLGKDEKTIYPLSALSTDEDDMDDFGDDINDDYEGDDEDDDDDSPSKTNGNTPIDTNNRDDQSTGKIPDAFDVPLAPITEDDNLNALRSQVPITWLSSRSLFMKTVPYFIGGFLVSSLVVGVFLSRYRIGQRRRSRQNGKYEKNYAFAEVNSCSPEDKALQAFQSNGYENPTYKFFESQTLKC